MMIALFILLALTASIEIVIAVLLVLKLMGKFDERQNYMSKLNDGSF